METEVTSKIEAFFQSLPSREYQKGQLIIDPSTSPAGLCYLESGTARQYTISPKGEEITLNIFRSPSFFPVDWVINDTPNDYYFEAIETTQIRIAPKKEALDFLRTNPDVLFDLLQRIYKGLNGYFKRVESLMVGSAKSRLIVQLVIHAKRFGQQALKITEGELASQAGMSRETVSRQIQILKKKGLVQFAQSMLIIPDIEKLEKEMVAE